MSINSRLKKLEQQAKTGGNTMRTTDGRRKLSNRELLLVNALYDAHDKLSEFQHNGSRLYRHGFHPRLRDSIKQAIISAQELLDHVEGQNDEIVR